MLNSVPTQLEQAKEHFYAWRMWEAYQLFRRFYDRLPFQQTPEHAEHIGMFVRTLLELGKEFELKFYRAELEKAYDRNRNAHIGYPLAIVIRDSEPRNIKRAADIFSEILLKAEGPLEAKCKMQLAYCMDALNRDVAGYRAVIDSIKFREDPKLNTLIELWRGKGCRDGRDFKQAETIFETVQASPECREDWYIWFTSQLLFAGLRLAQGEIAKAEAIQSEMEAFLKDKSFKTSQLQLERLASDIKDKKQGPPLIVDLSSDDMELSYFGKRLTLSRRTRPEKILSELVRNGSLKKARAIEILSKNRTTPIGDAVYQAMHTARGLLESLGLSRECIQSSGDHYIFVKNTTVIEG